MKIQIQEKEFTLKYNNKSLFKIEKEVGISIAKLFGDEKYKETIEMLHTIYTIVWAGVQESISFDEFSEIAQTEELTNLLPDVMQLINDSFDTGVKKK